MITNCVYDYLCIAYYLQYHQCSTTPYKQHILLVIWFFANVVTLDHREIPVQLLFDIALAADCSVSRLLYLSHYLLYTRMRNLLIRYSTLMVLVVKKLSKVNILKCTAVAYCGLDTCVLTNIVYWIIKLIACVQVAKTGWYWSGNQVWFEAFTCDKTVCYLCIAYIALVEAQLISFGFAMVAWFLASLVRIDFDFG